MPKTPVWSLPPQTEAKHTLLREYLKAWFPILAKSEDRIGYIDGFAGPGRYKGGEAGSPIVALETLLDHDRFATFKSDFAFKFVESDATRAQLLSDEIRILEASRGGFPANVSWTVEDTTFSSSVSSFLGSLGPGRRLIPALVLVDPFGFTGAPMQQIANLLRWDKCEVIVNFMFDSVNRWATGAVNPAVLTQFDQLFGCNTYRNAPAGGDQRKLFLRDLYGEQLETVANFKYVRWFEMVNERGRTGNFIFHGTRHEVGLERMKEAMWKVDPEWGIRFSVPSDDGTQQPLFAAGPHFEDLRKRIQTRFRGKRATIEEVLRFVCLETRYLQRHVKTRTLRPMQADGAITHVEGQRRAGEFPAGSVIHFA